MKNKSGLFRVLGAAALLISMLAATVAPAVAQDEGTSQDWLDALIDADGVGFLAGNNAIYYPWVSNDDDFGLGPADTSISVQNLEDRDTVISIYVGNASGGFDLATTAFLSAYAAKTFHASALGIAEGDGAPVQVMSFNGIAFTSIPGFVTPAGAIALVETPIILSNPITADDDGGESTQVLACVVNYHTAAQPGLGVPYGYVAAVAHVFDGTTYAAGDWVSFEDVENVQDALQTALNDANDDDPDLLINPFGGINNDADCFDVIDAVTSTLNDSVAIGGVAKQAVQGEALPATSAVDTAVSGYNAINGAELYYFGEWHLPIVQTNCGPGGCWDSVLRIGNFDSSNNAVEVRFFPADDGSGSLQTGFQLQALIDGGDTWSITLGDYVPEGWVGTAHIFTDGAVFPMVDRYKVGYNMWITNTGSSADFENVAQVANSNGRYALFAPHVLMDYFGWNTGINVANLVGTENDISIQYFNMFGNATQVLNQRLSAHGMTYFYDPSINAQNISDQDVTTDPNAGVVGSAIIWSDYPVAAAVDATKYPETDPTGGADLFQATSYSATANVFPWQAIPLVQKGNAIDGMGDTSGINIMNPNAEATTANVYWVNPSGFQATNFGVGSVTIPGFANGFVYTLWQLNLPNGFTGAAQVVADRPVAVVSANVNYEVDGDGSAIFNAYNPCGLYRSAGPCTFGDVFQPGGQSVTKYFVDAGFDLDDDADDTPIMGVNFSIYSTSGAGYQRDGVSGVDGSAIFTNVPVGTYELVVNSVPSGYELPEGVQDTFVVTEGEDVVLTNYLTAELEGFTKTVVVAGTLGDDDDIDAGTEFIAGVDVIVYNWVGTGTDGYVTGATQLTAQTDAAGVVGGNLAAGTYVLCLYDADGTATVDGTTVFPMLPAAPDRTFVNCEDFTIDDDGTVALVNEVELFAQGVSKTVVVAGTLGEDDEVTDGTVFLSGVNVAVFASVDGVISGDALDAGLSVNGGFAASLDPGTYFLCVYDADGVATILVDGEPVTVVVDLDSDIAGAVCEPFTVVLGETTILVNEVAVLTFGGIDVITEIGGDVAGSIPVTVYALADGDDCDDVTIGVGIVGTGTTTVGGTVSIGDLEPGLYCVVADFEGTLVLGEVTVVADVNVPILLDLELGVVTGGSVTTTVLNVEAAVLGAVVRIYDGACAGVTVDSALLFEGSTDGLGVVTAANVAVGDVCVQVDADYVEGGTFVADAEDDATVVFNTGVNVSLNIAV